MGIDFYYMPPSSPSRAALLAAKALGVEMNLIITNLLAGDHLKPEFLKMNPQHTIPTVNDDGFFMSESRPILQYLANAYGKDDSLYPKDPKKRFLVDHRLSFDQGTLYQRFGDLYYGIIHRGGSMDADKVKKLDEALGWLNDFLKDTKYVAGNNLTIADFTYAATLATIGSVGHDFSKFDRITRYYDRLRAELDGFSALNQQGADLFGQIAKPAIQRALGQNK